MKGLQKTAQILIVEDNPDWRAILADYLTHAGYEVLAVEQGEAALVCAAETAIDVALLDINLPGVSGVELAEALKQAYPGLEIIFMTAYGSTALAVELMQRGAGYYLEKPIALAELERQVARAALRQRRKGWWRRQRERLLEGESKVLALLAEGQTNAQIAKELQLSVHTVNTHVRNLLRKLGVRNRVQAALLWERCRGQGENT